MKRMLLLAAVACTLPAAAALAQAPAGKARSRQGRIHREGGLRSVPWGRRQQREPGESQPCGPGRRVSPCNFSIFSRAFASIRSCREWRRRSNPTT